MCRVLNISEIPGFRACMVFALARVAQSFEYAEYA